MDEICLWRSSATSVEAAGEQNGYCDQRLVRSLLYVPWWRGGSSALLHHIASYHLIAENDARFATANFSEGHYLQVEVAAKVKSTKNGELADKFLQFILSNEFQSVIPTGNWMYPVTAVELPKGLILWRYRHNLFLSAHRKSRKCVSHGFVSGSKR